MCCHTVYRSFRQARHLQEAWDDLARRVGADIFSTFDWCEIWWRYYGADRELEIQTFWQDGRLIGIVPLFYERLALGPVTVRTVRLLGADHSTTSCGVAVAPASVARIMNMLTKKLLSERRLDLMLFGPLPGYSRLGEALVAALDSMRDRMWSESVSRANHMVFSLPSTFDSYGKKLSKKERSNIRRDRRDLEHAGIVRHHVFTRQSDMPAALDAFISLHQTQWRSKGSLGHFRDWPAAEGFHREMVNRQSQRGRVCLTQLCVNRRVVAGQYCYRFGARAHWILSARRNGVGGRTAFDEMIRFLISGGVRQLDASAGLYDYKQRLGAEIVPTLWVLAGPHAWTRSQRVRLARSVAWLVDRAYYRFWYSRLARRMPCVRRPLWESWIRSHSLAP